MKRCIECGRRFDDTAETCPVDGEPLTPVDDSDDAPDDPETVVRPRRAEPLERPRFTEIPLERPAEPVRPEPARPEPVVTRTGEPDRVYRETSLWPAVIVVGVVIVAAAITFLVYVSMNESDLASEVGAQITEARVAVADARARLEALPAESSLRSNLLSLQQWDRELQSLELSGERTREVSFRAREIEGQARAISEQARIAASAGAENTNEPPPIDTTNGNANGNANSNEAAEPDEPDEGDSPPAEPPPPVDLPDAPPGMGNKNSNTGADQPRRPAPPRNSPDTSEPPPSDGV